MVCSWTLLPVALHRWNMSASGRPGISLQLMLMLLGFLTYKGAVIARGALDLPGSRADSP